MQMLNWGSAKADRALSCSAVATVLHIMFLVGKLKHKIYFKLHLVPNKSIGLQLVCISVHNSNIVYRLIPLISFSENSTVPAVPDKDTRIHPCHKSVAKLLQGTNRLWDQKTLSEW